MMSSTKMFQEFGEPNRRMLNINGPRPNLLSINKTSHAIRKPPQPSSFRKQQPVIIYTHSPKIIHSDAKDFMALVQNLTGLSRRSEDEIVQDQDKGFGVKKEKCGDLDESYMPSLIMTDEKIGDYEQKFNFAEFPLPTPNSSNFYCSPQSSYHRYYDASLLSLSPNMGNAVSSFLEIMKGLPEY